MPLAAQRADEMETHLGTTLDAVATLELASCCLPELAAEEEGAEPVAAAHTERHGRQRVCWQLRLQGSEPKDACRDRLSDQKETAPWHSG